MSEDEVMAVTLSGGESRHLVRLVTDRHERTLLKTDDGVSARVMKGLVAKGLAEAIVDGWRLTEAGRARSTAIY